MEFTPRNQERTEMVPFEMKVTSTALPFSLGAVRRAYLRCVRRDNKLYFQGRPIAEHGIPRFDYAANTVRSLARAPFLGQLGIG
jgi:hypothetical protein